VRTTDPLVLSPSRPEGSGGNADARASGEIPPRRSAQLDAMAAAFVDELAALAGHGPAFAEKLRAVQDLGASAVREAASATTRLGAAWNRAGAAGGRDPVRTAVAASSWIVALSRAMGRLDRRPDVEGHRAARADVQAIVGTLFAARDELRRDDAAIQRALADLAAATRRLREYVHLARALDGRLAAAAGGPSTDARAPGWRDDARRTVDRRLVDLLEQLAVSLHGSSALEAIRADDLAALASIERATRSAARALRTAAVVARAVGPVAQAVRPPPR
jgi:uncharacterized protein YaaN involved in tellurite resistance